MLRLPVESRQKPGGIDWSLPPLTADDCVRGPVVSLIASPTSTRSCRSWTPRLDPISFQQDAMITLHRAYDMLCSDCVRLGLGANGPVWSARRRFDGKRVAVKVTMGQARDHVRISESEILRSVQKVDGVVRLLDTYSDHVHEVLVMEVCGGSDLQERHGALSVVQVKCALRRALTILVGLHCTGVVHGDVRLENFMARDQGDQLDVTIIDFGSASRDRGVSYQDFQALGRMTYELVAGVRLMTSDIREMRVREVDDELAWDLIMLLTAAHDGSYSEVVHSAKSHAWFNTP